MLSRARPAKYNLGFSLPSCPSRKARLDACKDHGDCGRRQRRDGGARRHATVWRFPCRAVHHHTAEPPAPYATSHCVFGFLGPQSRPALRCGKDSLARSTSVRAAMRWRESMGLGLKGGDWWNESIWGSEQRDVVGERKQTTRHRLAGFRTTSFRKIGG